MVDDVPHVVPRATTDENNLTISRFCHEDCTQYVEMRIHNGQYMPAGRSTGQPLIACCCQIRGPVDTLSACPLGEPELPKL